MKIMMFEADKEELAANKRIADTLVDTISTFLDSFTRLSDYSNFTLDDDDDDDNNDDDNNNDEEE